MNESQDKEEFDTWMRGESPLSGAYGRLDREGPPEHVDAAILAEAARAVAGRRRDAGRMRRWLLPLSVAATVMLSFTVVLELFVLPDTPVVISEAPVSSAMPQAAKSSNAEAIMAEDRENERREAAVAESVDAPTHDGQRRTQDAFAADAARLAELARAPGNSPAAGAPGFAPPPREPAARSSAPRSEERQYPSMTDMPLAAPRASAARDSTMRARQAAPAAAASVPEADTALRAEAPAAPDASPDLRSQPGQTTHAGMAISASKADWTPEQWLRRIRTLAESGDEELALEQLKEFRNSFPAHPLPEDFPVEDPAPVEATP